MASWLVGLTLDRAAQVRALAGGILLCSWTRHFTLTVPLSPPRCINGYWRILFLRVTLQWTRIPFRGSRNTPSCSMIILLKPKTSASLMGHRFYLLPDFTEYLYILKASVAIWLLLCCLYRWANQGLDFLTVACDPKTLTTLSESAFQVNWNYKNCSLLKLNLGMDPSYVVSHGAFIIALILTI